MRVHPSVAVLLTTLLVSAAVFTAMGQEATPTAEGGTPEATPPPPPAAPGVATPGGDLPGDPAIQLVKVADGLADPIYATSANDGSGRIFVVERPGRIRIIDQDGNLLEEPFLDITDRVNSYTLEQGLLGLAFHPDYETNGFFYVLYTDLLRNGDEFLIRFTVSADDPNKADVESDRVVMFIPQPYVNHNGGTIQFGPDGYLYVGIGDGGLEGDPLEAGQRIDTLLGKMLRIDVNVEEGFDYAIPPDNPFQGPEEKPVTNLFAHTEEEFAQLRPEARREIWTYGLRNPWGFSFDRATGDIYIPDAGQNFYEEIHFEPADSPGAVNYGWALMEASHCFPVSQQECGRGEAVLPVAEYRHGENGCVIVGIGVYRGQEIPDLDGVYLSGDYCSGKVWGLARDEGGTWQFQELLDTALLLTGGGEDEAGRLYVASCQCNYALERQRNPLEELGGSLWRVVAADQVPAGAETPPAGQPPVDPAAGEAIGTPPAGATPQAEGTPAEGTPAAGGETAAQVTVEMVDIDFNPNEFAIPADTDVTVDLPNNGAVVHNFHVDALDVHSEDVQPGGSTTVTINAAPGDYEYYCSIPGHREAGMVGTLTVQ